MESEGGTHCDTLEDQIGLCFKKKSRLHMILELAVHAFKFNLYTD